MAGTLENVPRRPLRTTILLVRPATLRRTLYASSVALCAAVLFITAVRGLAPDYPMRLIQGVLAAGGALGLLGWAVAWVTTKLGDYREPADEAAFERLVLRSERLAREDLAAEPEEGEFLELDPYNPRDFEELIQDALDDLPDILRSALDRNVAVLISDQGRRHRAYGLYQGNTVTRDDSSARIVIFRDTLLRDFGHDPDELRAQVLRTVRHELAHHLGADELGVRELGL
jgi:predicted Zn-dependent protease with MMP-like domain